MFKCRRLLLLLLLQCAKTTTTTTITATTTTTTILKISFLFLKCILFNSSIKFHMLYNHQLIILIKYALNSSSSTQNSNQTKLLNNFSTHSLRAFICNIIIVVITIYSLCKMLKLFTLTYLLTDILSCNFTQICMAKNV